MAKYAYNIEGKKSKFVTPGGKGIGHIELRSEKSERNVAKIKAKKAALKKMKGLNNTNLD